jgi:FKBP-type peptidyl-prolyl cis-trans isomerase
MTKDFYKEKITLIKYKIMMNKLENKHILKNPFRGLGVIVLLSLLFFFPACNEDDNSTTQWRLDNQAAYDKIKADPEWKELKTNNVEGPSGVYYKDLTEAGAEKGTEHPLQTASVTINYTGKLYTETVFDSGVKSTFNVNAVVRGFSAALQNMVVGETWEVCIPYYLGYGATGSGSIKAYTTLFFEIELLKIDQHPK